MVIVWKNILSRSLRGTYSKLFPLPRISTLNVNLQRKSTLFPGFRGPNAKCVFHDGKTHVFLMVEFRTGRKAVVKRRETVLIRKTPGFPQETRRKPVETRRKKGVFRFVFQGNSNGSNNTCFTSILATVPENHYIMAVNGEKVG